MQQLLALALLTLCAALPAQALDTYQQEEILKKVETYFGQGAESLGLVVQRAFKDHGEPNAYIAGEEVAAALGVGLRYGRGLLNVKDNEERQIFWQGPSIGLDLGANISKVFVLVYHLPSEEALFQRFPGIEGSLYFVGGVGVNYLQTREIVVAPIRLGAGWRQGLSAGYMDFTERMHYNPF
jgi:hypothetical protein